MLLCLWVCVALVVVDSFTYIHLHDSNNRTFCLELWDIGGFAGHQNSRSIFYQPVHGLILVHDLTNRKSHANLNKWLMEVLRSNPDGCESLSSLNSRGSRSLTRDARVDYDPEQLVGSDLFPILVVGTKQDQVGFNVSRRSTVAEETGAESMLVDCFNGRQFTVGSTHEAQLRAFFDKVIEHRFSRSIGDRRRSSIINRQIS